MKQKHQQTLKSLYLQGFRQKIRTLKSVSFLVSYGGCGSRTEKIAVATKQSTGLFLPNQRFGVLVGGSSPRIIIDNIKEKKKATPKCCLELIGGLEPPTSSLPRTRSTTWAISAKNSGRQDKILSPHGDPKRARTVDLQRDRLAF